MRAAGYPDPSSTISSPSCVTSSISRPAPPQAPKGRALATVDLLADSRRCARTAPDERGATCDSRWHPHGPGVSPLDRLDDVWRGGQPLWATVLSPFWDDTVPAPAVEAVRRRLTGRPASSRWMTLVVAVDPVHRHRAGTGRRWRHEPEASVTLSTHRTPSYAPCTPSCLLIESDDWLAALIGSSNATEAGMGLNADHGHHELNLWIGCPAGSKTAKHLRSLAQIGEAIDLDDAGVGTGPG